MQRRMHARSFRRQFNTAALMMTVLVALSCLSACDGGGEKVIVVTATPTAGQQVVFVTATFTPAQPADGSVPPTVDVQATVEAALAATQAAAPTDTPIPPTDTPLALPTNTLIPPTDTPPPPTNTPKPTTKPTSKPKPTATPASYPPPTLLSPDVDFSCYNAQGCSFSWSWGRSLAANQYFQVQLVGPNNEHRGIHPPTKDFSFQSNWSVYQIIRDWCDPSKMCHMQWTVAVVEWDGVDPSKIGRTLVETQPPRWVWL